MKLQLDTEEKLITIEDSVIIGELLKVLKEILPNGLWKKYSIKSATIDNWYNPIYIRDYTYPYPWYSIGTNVPNPYEITFALSSGNGIYNIDTANITDVSNIDTDLITLTSGASHSALSELNV